MSSLRSGWQAALAQREERKKARSRYLVQAIILEEKNSVYGLNRTIQIIAALIVGSIVWCHFSKFPEVVSANGEIVPYGRIHKIQHLDGGIVEGIYIRNGDRVERGDTLITLNDESLRAELNSRQSAKLDLQLRDERLLALLEQRPPQFSTLAGQNSSLSQVHLDLYNEQQNNDKTRLDTLTNKITNRRSELSTKKKQQQVLRDEVAIYQQQYQMRQTLFAEKQVAKVDMLDASARLASAKNRLTQVAGEQERLLHAIDELQQEQQQYRSQRREVLNTERSEVVRQLAMINQQIIDLQSRIERTKIRAKIPGIVNSLNISSINAVVAPGEVLMQLVPVGDELLVEARLAPENIGHVILGQKVEVKVSSFEYMRFGTIAGSVANVSAATYFDSEAGPYYLAEIKLAQAFVGNEHSKNIIVPGMTVQAEIITGEKSVLSYLLKPLQRGFDDAFRER